MRMPIEITERNNDSLKTITTLVYALQAASFLLGITFIIAVIINYVKKSDLNGTWLESHFKWQMRTFWLSFLWSSIGLVLTPFVIGYLLLYVNMFWIIYRIIKGWLRLNDGKEIY